MSQPKQQRSQQTQQRLLLALDACLQRKYFEQITVAELAAEAGVSVGTVYRRFKDKEALLPLLYQRFSDDLQRWLSSFTGQSLASFEQALQRYCVETWQFMSAQRHVLRTVHLNARLHAEALPQAQLQGRSTEYQLLQQWLASHLSQAQQERCHEQLQLVVFTVTSTTLEKVLYPQLTPAIACEQQGQQFAQALAQLLGGSFTSVTI
ncbi:TetR/AcrR family transcriptional regulator [Ferrimonas senticii]|uniref:TetR/AcrR family transcriptional regulator n=1 Tax=Ferrimonas senticii TaxID=394566 RepID=UPI00041FEB8C|nr:TetR/AcrR family transcriptional regulator [Ferrimonas senticii]